MGIAGFSFETLFVRKFLRDGQARLSWAARSTLSSNPFFEP
jgi:hypothetical protein